MRRLTPLLLVLCIGAAAQAADDPLHVRIDRVVAEGGIGILSDRCDDGTFLRRVYLDLANRIPTGAEARDFLTDKSPDKRRKLVDRLIASDHFNHRLVNFFDVMLMERRADKNVKAAEWRGYLLESLRANKPYNVLAREVLGSDGVDAKLRPAAKFFLDRDSEPNLMTRDIARMFFGMDLQCAQCHDHPLVEDYFQRDYYGIYAFVNRTYVFDDKKAKKKFLAEKAEGEVDYKSVFTEQSGFARPRLPGEAAVGEPKLAIDDEWKVAPAKDVRPVPKYSRRELLAEQVLGGGNDAFTRNIVNRLWAMVMGRGIVEPVDFNHTANPPSNPQLLQLLAESFRESKFDVKAFVRELALSETYQRSMAAPKNLAALRAQTQTTIDQLTKQQEPLDKAAQAADVAFLELVESVAEAREKMLPVRGERDKARKAWADAKKKSDAAVKPIAATTAKRDAEKKVVDAIAPVLAAATASAKAIPDDKSLADAAAKLKARHDKHAAQLAAHQKTLTAQTTAANKAKETLAKSLANYEAQRDKLETLDGQSREIEVKLAAAQRKRRSVVLTAKQAEQRLTWAKSYLAALDAEAAQATVEKEVAAAAAKAAQLAKAASDQQQQSTQMAETLASMELQTEKAMARRIELQAAMDRLAVQQRAVAELTQKLNALVKSLADAELQQAANRAAAREQALAADVQTAAKTVDAQKQVVADSQKKVADAKSKIAKLKTQVKQLTEQRVAALAARDKQLASLEELNNKRSESVNALFDSLSRHSAVADLKPLSPEQMAWSMMQVGGMIERQVAASRAELDKKKPLDDAAKKDPQKVAEREREVQSAAQAKLAGNVSPFVKLYGGGPGQPQTEFFATVDQALFASNGGQMRSWFSVAASTLAKETDTGKVADELYLSVLTRFPSDEEKSDVAGYLKDRDADRKAAVEEMIWALATSVEFRFGH